MSASRYILAGLLAALGAPAVVHASSAGLSQYELEHGETPLLSQRSAFMKGRDRQAQSARRTVARTSDEKARHADAMGTGVVPMTNGAAQGGQK